jgi:O-antigen/teichoic acid export membrane protein
MLVFARLAGPTAAGDFALAAAFLGFLAPLAEAGIGQAVIQAKSLRQEQLATVAWVSFALGLFLLLLSWLSAGPLATWYDRPDLAGLLPLMASSLLVTPFGMVQGGLIIRDFRFDLAARIEVGAFALGFLLLVFLLWQGWGVWAMAWSFVLRNSLAALACLWFTRQHYPVNWLKTSSLQEVWPLLRFGSLDLSARWADFLANYLDKLIIGKWLGATALGYYHIAFSLCVLPTARLGTIITRVSYPVFAKVRNDAAQLQAYFQRAAQEVVLVLFPVYLGMAIFSEELIWLMYGPDWLAAAPLLFAFSFAGLVRSLNAVFPQLTKGIGKPQLTTAWMVLWTLALTLFLVVFLWFEPTVLAAAWSRVAAKFVVELGLLFLLGQWCRVHFGPVFRYAGRLLLAAIPVLILAYLVSVLFAGFWLVFALKMLVCLGALAWLVFWSPWKTDIEYVFRTFFKGGQE